MKTLTKAVIISFFILLVYSFSTLEKYGSNDALIIQQIRFDPNNIDTWIENTGIADQDLRTSNTPGFQWPRGSGKYAIFTDGLSTAAMVNGSLRMAMASYKGEYSPGYISHSTGHPVAQTDSTFKFYKVKRGDNWINNYDWLVWGRMVPYGAPFVDVNHNGTYEPMIDTPGVRGASQTIFICLTDGFLSSHITSEGFGGGTSPLFAELHLTAWGYDNPGYQDMIFKKFELINKNDTAWNSSYTGIVSDPDLGYPDDDYIGCDTSRGLGYCYNGDNNDDGGSYSYGINPPAVGFKWLTCPGASSVSLASVTYFYIPGVPSPPACENPNGQLEAYNILKGLKNDQTPWVIPPGGSPQYKTKYCYSGDPESGIGWTEGLPGNPHGSIQNCGGPDSLSGNYIPVNLVGDRRLIMSSGSDNHTVMPNDTVRIIIAELIARGTSNLNSVTKLKQLSDVAQRLCDSGFVIGVNKLSSEVPNTFVLYQNYPNPFNPVTKIRFNIPPSKGTVGMISKLVVYDALGKEVSVLVNENLKPGTYEAEWDGTNYPSGVYFYKLVVSPALSGINSAEPLTKGSYSETKKMVLIK